MCDWHRAEFNTNKPPRIHQLGSCFTSLRWPAILFGWPCVPLKGFCVFTVVWVVLSLKMDKLSMSTHVNSLSSVSVVQSCIYNICILLSTGLLASNNHEQLTWRNLKYNIHPDPYHHPMLRNGKTSAKISTNAHLLENKHLLKLVSFLVWCKSEETLECAEKRRWQIKWIQFFWQNVKVIFS